MIADLISRIEPDRPPRLLGLFAHPDDEVFCCGGLMAQQSALGAASAVLSLTKGEAGQIRDASLATRSTLGARRQAELEAAARLLGVGDVRCLNHADGTLDRVDREALVAEAVPLAESFAPDVIISFGPDGGYGHPDHITVSEVAAEVSARLDRRPAYLQAVFPRRSQLLIELVVGWLSDLDDRFRGSPEFAHGLMLFADGSSMLGYAADQMDVRFFPPGTCIIEQGEPPGELYLVLSGTVDVVHERADGSLDRLATMGAGSFVGEDGIARGQPRNANVIAVDSVTCFVLSPGRGSLSAGRGAGTAQPRFDDSPDGAAGIPPGCFEVDVREFASTKMAALACHRSQYAIDADMFPASIVEEILGTEVFRQVELG